ncbi:MULTISPECIES: RAMP superfamily CRISPR-associated protein [Metallosphaera]|uniref:CRISPR-associated protein n=3 Tax=Metallosphaera TaxID=41980 RepID=A4YFX5_METS5|nr:MULTISPECIES: RAMP superfamily CRISPR-associated protein [Metallosphaera]ABP95327.1 CRISPR-associated protein [Metallosphaera sedula DSM 5348]AIM27313.1 CRISPR-associated protein [Metallosphaera sedula]AKV74197.1 hypothetical protein MsedA_1183 [Metallosphaera sedula]AKV76436.1 hypothetical protein MsedB_1185 [Metallosphaera sedula]AKV78688.1 hypothetical protein MsedC_1183 [Metallosphaera sedula]
MIVHDLVFRLEEVRIGTTSLGNELEALKYGDTYVIPFSTWKGAFRSTTEAIVEQPDSQNVINLLMDKVNAAIDKAEEWNPVVARRVFWEIAKEVKGLNYPEIEGLDRVLKDVLNPEATRDDTKRLVKEIIRSYLSPVDRLYGGPGPDAEVREFGFAGALIFSDSVMRGAERGMVTKTSIDRRTRKVAEHMLFTEEVVYPKSVRVRVILHRVPDFALKAWVNTLRFLAEVGLGLGSGKSRRSWATLDPGDSKVAEASLNQILEGQKWKSLGEWLKGRP